MSTQTGTANNSASPALGCMALWGGNRNVEETFALPGLDAWIYSRAYQSDSGGDLYYVSTCAHSAVLRFVVADVAGHGAKVSPIAARLKRMLIKHMNKLDQSRLAHALNDEFSRDTEAGVFVTSLMASYYRPSGHLVICNAGHPRPLLYRAAEKTWRLLDMPVESEQQQVMNLPLGILKPTDYYQYAVELSFGDYVVLYSDGFSDVRVDGGVLGEAGMCEIARECEYTDASELGQQLLARTASYRGVTDGADDETLVVLRPINRAAPKYSMAERIRTLGKTLGVVRIE